jgi:hypothetical protein
MIERWSEAILTGTGTVHLSDEELAETLRDNDSVATLRENDMHAAADLLEAEKTTADLSEDMKHQIERIATLERIGWQSSADELRKQIPLGGAEIDAQITVNK